MANVNHEDVVDPYIHDVKGASTATTGTILVANGVGASVWLNPNPHGYIHMWGAVSLARSSSYVVLNSATDTSTNAKNFTESTTGKLTYTGAQTIPVEVVGDVVWRPSITSDVNATFAIYLNGAIVATSQVMTTTLYPSWEQTVIRCLISMAQNDYVQIYRKDDAGSGNFLVNSYSLSAILVIN